MDIITEKMGSVLKNAKAVIDLDRSGKIDQLSKGVMESATRTESGDISFAMPSNNSYQAPTMPKSMPTNSKLPKEIIESMINNPINNEMDNIMASMTPENMGIQKNVIPQPKKQVIREEVTSAPSQVQGVDYSLIKTIVEDVVRKYSNAIAKKVINESKGSDGMLKAMKIGEKFSFITDSGDIYEATLKKKKNIND